MRIRTPQDISCSNDYRIPFPPFHQAVQQILHFIFVSDITIKKQFKYVLWNRVLNFLATFNYIALILFMTVLLTALSGESLIGNEICSFIAPCTIPAMWTLLVLGIICPIVYLIRDGNHSMKCFSISAAIVISVACNVLLSDYYPNTITVSVFLVIFVSILYKEFIYIKRRGMREIALYTIEDILIYMDVLYVCALLIHSS